MNENDNLERKSFRWFLWIGIAALIVGILSWRAELFAVAIPATLVTVFCLGTLAYEAIDAWLAKRIERLGNWSERKYLERREREEQNPESLAREEQEQEPQKPEPERQRGERDGQA